jgi:Phytanoyl-CoA dioxygenase (PhyH)
MLDTRIGRRLKSSVKDLIGTAERATMRFEYAWRGGEELFRKRYFADVPVNFGQIREYRAENFPKSGPEPWLDQPNARELIEAKRRSNELNAEEAALCEKWVQDGYVIFRNPYPESFLNEVWTAYQRAVDQNIVRLMPEKVSEADSLPGRYLNPHLLVPQLKDLLYSPEVVRAISLLLGRPAAPFQTITAHKGSQQLEHSDSIHMTTYPMGYLAASWTAFEDIHPDSGPLVYYPGSHRLPYYLSKEVGIEPGVFKRRGYDAYFEFYEPFIQQVIRDRALKPVYFHAAKGDVFLWHANLIHGGAKRKDVARSRRSVVCHYFAEGAFCYHDLAGTRADRRHAADASGYF